ncbi:hypothetical protein VKT23_017299 [Stygiomarasmius scandens]|uniref:Aminoglycoside phosphotransferase domain-containing protein n=1 Tax=Marasmiellus scandens TaxID=2682957 RepID=A0ABR1IV08_9AGAR
MLNYETPFTHDKASPIDSFSDEELQILIKGIDRTSDAIGATPQLGTLGKPPVYRLRPYELVVKFSRNDHGNEPYIMEYVRQHTHIPIPRVHRVLQDPSELGIWIVMDYIEGECLLTRWHALSWWQRLQIVFILRSYVQRLHRTPVPHPDVPGPFNETGQPLPCHGGHLDAVGPFPTYADLASWHDRMQISLLSRRRDTMRYPKFDTSYPLVLCHFDLHMRNIILDKDNRVWLVDWGYAGVYPSWFEYLPLASWANAPHSAYRLPRSFAIFASFITGDYYWYYKNYILPLILHLESCPQQLINNYFAKLDYDPVLYYPSDVARPPLSQRMMRGVLDIVYSGLSTVWSLCVGK